MLLLILIAVSAWILGLFLPWWSIALPCIIFGCWLGEKAGRSFFYGFLGIGLLWLIQTLLIHIGSDGILTTRIAELFSLPNSLLVILVTVIVGGVAGGFSTMTGYLFRMAFIDK